MDNEILELIDRLDRSMECTLESDPRTLIDKYHEFGYVFDRIGDWREELREIENLINKKG